MVCANRESLAKACLRQMIVVSKYQLYPSKFSVVDGGALPPWSLKGGASTELLRVRDWHFA